MTQGEIHLKAMLMSFENKYFKDLTLQDTVLQKQLLSHLFESDSKESVLPNPETKKISKLLSIEFYNVKIRDFDEGTEGLHNANTKTIYLSKRLEGEQRISSTLLHEMLHAYEYRIHRAFHSLYQPLLIHTYEDLKRNLGEQKFGQVMTNLPREVRSTLDGHSLFFWLKSLELDLKLDYKPGTVAGFDAPF